MLNQSKINKVDILTLGNTRIMTLNANQFTIPLGTEKNGNQIIIKGREIPEIAQNSPLYLIMYMRSGERIRYSAKVSLSTPFQLNILVSLGDIEVLKERRRFYKVDTNLPCKVTGILRNKVPINLENEQSASIGNMNIGGIFLETSDLQLEKEDLIYLRINLDNSITNVLAKVLRSQFNAAGELIGYGCEFVDISPQNEELFAKFIYKKQLEERNKKKQQTF